MSATIKGPFEVKLLPLELGLLHDEPGFARMSIDKQFEGDLSALSKGEMLSAGTSVKGSAGYVAIEKVTGSLQGKKGSFVLQHNATMNRGIPSLSISVVPDSGTEELTGISGTMSIEIVEKKHFYIFDYTIDSQL